MLARQLRQSIAAYVDLALDLADSDNRESRIRAALTQSAVDYLLDQDCGLGQQQIRSLLDMDMGLNAQGLEHWLATRTA